MEIKHKKLIQTTKAFECRNISCENAINPLTARGVMVTDWMEGDDVPICEQCNLPMSEDTFNHPA